jgi:hypothetical protein
LNGFSGGAFIVSWYDYLGWAADWQWFRFRSIFMLGLWN